MRIGVSAGTNSQSQSQAIQRPAVVDTNALEYKAIAHHPAGAVLINSDVYRAITHEQLAFKLDKGALNNRVVVVSGATGGLGTVLCQSLAVAGATVVLIARKLDKLEALYDSIVSVEGCATPAIITLDQSSAPETDYLQLSELLANEFGHIDALVHTAADVGVLSPLIQIKQADWSRVMAVNLTSARLLTNACLPLLNESDNASITFTLDDKTGAYWGAYGVSKAALRHLAHTVFDETENQRAADGTPKIAVNAIDPGAMRTPLRRKAFPGELESETQPPQSRLGPFLALISRQNKALNGQALKSL